MQSIAKQEGGGQQGETGREEFFKFLLKILNILDVNARLFIINCCHDCMDSNGQQDHEDRHSCCGVTTYREMRPQSAQLSGGIKGAQSPQEEGWNGRAHKRWLADLGVNCGCIYRWRSFRWRYEQEEVKEHMPEWWRMVGSNHIGQLLLAETSV